ncbi:MAG: PorV/PorQ family protein [candidate division WOR-3 bacterium]
MKRRVYWLLVPVVFSLVSASQNPGAVFLIIWPAARPTSLAGAFTAISDDASGLYYNPGGMAFLNGTNATLMHCNWLPGLWPGMYYEYAGVAHNFPDKGTAGFNFIYLTTGETDVINERGEFLGRYTTFDLAPTLGYAFPVLPNLGVGISAKLIYSFLVPDWVWKVMPELGIEAGGTGISWAFDAGVLYKPVHFLNVGASFANLGPNISYTSSGESDPLPRMLRVGLAYYPLKTDMFTVAITPEITKLMVGVFSDSTKSFGQQFAAEWRDAWKSLGLEAGVNLDVVAAFLRLGYFEDVTAQRGGLVFEKDGQTYHYSVQDLLTRRGLGSFKSLGWTFGAGIRFQRFQFDIGVDQFIYDFSTSNYKFSFSYQF